MIIKLAKDEMFVLSSRLFEEFLFYILMISSFIWL